MKCMRLLAVVPLLIAGCAHSSGSAKAVSQGEENVVYSQPMTTTTSYLRAADRDPASTRPPFHSEHVRQATEKPGLTGSDRTSGTKGERTKEKPDKPDKPDKPVKERPSKD